MALNDPLANVLSQIHNCEKKGIPSCESRPSSKTIKAVLSVLKDHHYIGACETLTEEKGGELKIHLLGNINKCGVIKPRYSVKNNEFEKFEKRYLPAKDLGILFVSTPKGIMTHYDAKAKKQGGRLLAYCY